MHLGPIPAETGDSGGLARTAVRRVSDASNHVQGLVAAGDLELQGDLGTDGVGRVGLDEQAALVDVPCELREQLVDRVIDDLDDQVRAFGFAPIEIRVRHGLGELLNGRFRHRRRLPRMARPGDGAGAGLRGLIDRTPGGP